MNTFLKIFWLYIGVEVALFSFFWLIGWQYVAPMMIFAGIAALAGYATRKLGPKWGA